MNKIIFTGPESTGKSTLAKICSEKYNLPLVEEYARAYLDELTENYKIEDLHTIAHQHHKLIEEASSKHNFIVCDTDLLTMIIWYEDKYKRVPEWITRAWTLDSSSRYFLCLPDIPWIDDPQREHPKDRNRLYNLHLKYLKKYKKPYVSVNGDYNIRQEIVYNEMKKFLIDIH